MLASSQAVAAGSIASNSGSLRDRRRAYVHVSAELPKAHDRAAPDQLDLMKFWYERDGVGPRWPWYLEPACALP